MKHVPSVSISKDSLSNKNILITGAGSGIGRAVAKIAAKNKANLILLSKDIKKLYSLQDEICDEGGNDPLIVEFDFLKASEKDYKKLADSLYQNYEKLDGLVHVAGVLGYLSPIINTSFHWIKNSEFRKAIRNFCDEESRNILKYFEQSKKYLPFKNARI